AALRCAVPDPGRSHHRRQPGDGGRAARQRFPRRRRQLHGKAAAAVYGEVTRKKGGGARRDRTADLVIANDALSQLSYGPIATALTLTTADNRRHLQSAPRPSQEPRNRCFPR